MSSDWDIFCIQICVNIGVIAALVVTVHVARRNNSLNQNTQWNKAELCKSSLVQVDLNSTGSSLSEASISTTPPSLGFNTSSPSKLTDSGYFIEQVNHRDYFEVISISVPSYLDSTMFNPKGKKFTVYNIQACVLEKGTQKLAGGTIQKCNVWRRFDDIFTVHASVRMSLSREDSNLFPKKTLLASSKIRGNSNCLPELKTKNLLLCGESTKPNSLSCDTAKCALLYIPQILDPHSHPHAPTHPNLCVCAWHRQAHSSLTKGARSLRCTSGC
jgi:hypothetical protein